MPLRVMVVDDSAFMRRTIADLLRSDPGVEVAGSAVNGLDALRKLAVISPDVIVMDVDMPVMDGIAATERIMAESPRPTVILSGDTPDMTVRALQLGAVDFLAKPHAHPSVLDYALRDELLSKIRSAARSRTPKLGSPNGANSPKGMSSDRVLVIGSGEGGPQALSYLFADLNAAFAADVLVLPGLPRELAECLAYRLSAIASLPVSVAGEKGRLSGTVLIVPAGYATRLDNAGGFELMETRNPINTALTEAARHFGSRCVGAVLTGSGEDGAEGLAAVAHAGGMAVVQSPESCMVADMAEAAIRTGKVTRIEPLENMAHSFLEETL